MPAIEKKTNHALMSY